MSLEALMNVSRKKERLAEVRRKAERSRKEWLAKEQEAVESLENITLFLTDRKLVSVSRVAQELNCSRDKVRGMVERARLRNTKLMRGGKP